MTKSDHPANTNAFPLELIPLENIGAAYVEALLDDAFGLDRHGRTAYRLRTGLEPLAALSFAAINGAVMDERGEDQGELCGTIQCWPVALKDANGKRYPMIMVGPVAVSPKRQNIGIGRALMAAVFEALETDKAMPLMLIGDPDYYGRHFGFSAEWTTDWQLPGRVIQSDY